MTSKMRYLQVAHELSKIEHQLL